MAEKNVSELDSAGLKAELLELRKEQFNLRMQRSTGQLANPSRLKAVRRQIARDRSSTSPEPAFLVQGIGQSGGCSNRRKCTRHP